MNKTALSPWYYDYLDQIANLELKNKRAQQGGTELRYRIARQKQGNASICGQIAHALMPGLAGSTVILVTGTGNPVWLPRGETDGPSGVAVLARVLSTLGVRSCVLSEARFLPGIAASVQAAGTPLLDEAQWLQRSNAALCLEFPTGQAAAAPFINDLLARMPKVSAAFFIEKPGPGAAGLFHNSSGKPKGTDWVAHAHLLASAASARGAITVGIGDGGNEIGFGLIQSELHAEAGHRFSCDCGCPNGLLDATEVDFLLPAAVSNWGAYAVAAALSLACRRYTLLPSWEEVSGSISAPIPHGALDGYSGLAVPTVDGVSFAANQAAYALMNEVVRLARESEEQAPGAG